MAGGGQEARLGDIGVIGFLLGAAEFAVQARELFGAFAHALFKRFIGAFQRFFGSHCFRHICVSRHDTAIGQA